MTVAAHSLERDSLATRHVQWVGLVIVLAVFAPSWLAFPSVWLEHRDHGFAIAAYCLWMAWMRREQLLGGEAEQPGLWTAAALLGSLGWMLLYILDVRVLYLAATVGVLLAWIGATAGTRGLRAALPIAATFAIALPVWEVLYAPLKAGTVAVNGLLVRATGLNAVLEGPRVILPEGVLEIADACAGLNYFMAGLTVAVIHALTFLRGTRPRVLSIALGVGISVVSNWVRVFGLVWLAETSHMQSEIVKDHGLYGWVIFAVAMGLFLVATAPIERWDRRITLVDAGHDGPSPAVDGARSASAGRIVLPTAAAAVGPLLFGAVSLVPVRAVPSPQVPGLAAAAGWELQQELSLRPARRGDPAPSDSSADSASWRPRFNDATSHQRLVFIRAGGEVQVDRLIYGGHGQEAELIGSLNRIAPAKETIAERTFGPVDDRGRVVAEAVVRHRGGARLVWYWYHVAGTTTAMPATAKVLELARFFGRTSGSELVTVSAACGPTDCENAGRALYSLVTGRELPERTGEPNAPRDRR
jgi:exosortase